MNFSNLKSKFDIKKYFQSVRLCLLGKRRLILLIIAVMLFLYCGYLWNKYIYNPSISENEKQQYFQSKYNETIFNQEKFDKVFLEIQGRKEENKKNISAVKNIFWSD